MQAAVKGCVLAEPSAQNLYSHREFIGPVSEDEAACARVTSKLKEGHAHLTCGSSCTDFEGDRVLIQSKAVKDGRAVGSKVLVKLCNMLADLSHLSVGGPTSRPFTFRAVGTLVGGSAVLRFLEKDSPTFPGA